MDNVNQKTLFFGDVVRFKDSQGNVYEGVIREVRHREQLETLYIIKEIMAVEDDKLVATDDYKIYGAMRNREEIEPVLDEKGLVQSVGRLTLSDKIGQLWDDLRAHWAT